MLLFLGVMRHVGAALAEKSVKKRKKHIVAIGIAPWGVVHKRHDLKDQHVCASFCYKSLFVLRGSRC